MPRRAPTASASSRLAAGASLLLIALLLAVAAGPLDAPYLDARLHTQFDNAWFTFMARNGLRNDDARSQMGVTLNRYERWGERVGEPGYYTHHPFLLKTLFQQFARVAGTGEAAARAFALAVSFGIAASVLLFVRRTTGRLAAGLAAAAVLASIPVFSRFAATLKFESDGMLAATLFLLALERALRIPDRRSAVLVALAAGAAALAHWSGALAVATICGLLLARSLRRTAPGSRAALGAAAAGLAGGLAALAGLVVWLQHGAAPAWRSLAGGFGTRASAAGLPLGAWLPRQWLYLLENFGLPLLVMSLGGFALVTTWPRRSDGGHSAATAETGAWLLRLATAATLITGAIWVAAFRQGSFVHSYWQLWLALPVAFVVGEGVARIRPGQRSAVAVGATVVALVAYLQAGNASRQHQAASLNLGTPGDIAFLTSLRDWRGGRLVFVAVSQDARNGWFSGPHFEYYTDRPVTVAGASEHLAPDDIVLLLRQTEQERITAEIGSRFGVRLRDERCSERLCAHLVDRL